MPFTVATVSACASGLLHEFLSQISKDTVAGDASHVIHTLFFKVIEDLGTGETTIKTNQNTSPWESSSQPGQSPVQDADQAETGIRITGFEHAGEHELLILAVEIQEAQHGQVAVTAVEARSEERRVGTGLS